MIKISREKIDDSYEIEVLLDLVFGLGRETLSSYRFRDGIERINDLSYILRDDFAVLVGVIRFWPVLLGNQRLPALLLGPLGVHPTRQGEGLGELLIRASLNKAIKLGWKRVILIGDAAYYTRFGFSRKRVSKLYLEDKVNSGRLLGRELVFGSMKYLEGPVIRYIEKKEN